MSNYEHEFTEIKQSFPNLVWSYIVKDDRRVYTGKCRDVHVATIFEPKSQLVIHSVARSIITKYTQCAETAVNFLLQNNIVFNVNEFNDAFRKVCECAEYSIKRYYFEQQQEMIYGEKHF